MSTKKIIFYSPSKNKLKEISVSSSKIVVLILLAVITISFSATYFSKAYISEQKDSEIEKLIAKNNALTKELETIDKKIAGLNDVLFQIQSVDDRLRLETNIALIDDDVRNLGVGGTEIDFYLDENLGDHEIKSIVEKKTDLDDIERKLEFELESFKSIFSLIKSKEDSLKYLPTILPIPKDLYRETSRFGNRVHPILGINKNHSGVDMGCAIGTPIYATADGVIDYAGVNGGYGKYVKIEHRNFNKDYKYETRYGHMSKIFVKKGQKVKRGDIIGEVGNTGRTTAPHLHYEVRYQRKALKPNDYYFVNID